MPLIEVKADVEKNRLYMKLVGLPTPEKAVELKSRLIIELRKLKPGFTMLNDSRGLLLEKGNITGMVTEIMQAIAAGKPSKVARVVNELAAEPLEEISTNVGYQVRVFDSVQKAEKFLDS
ncbi:MAG TPA: hypothetical protein ENL08_00965 [Bacteroidetes bacterium]|nr:hypothetical protein [Bacteroidota bacterium]